MPWSVVKGGGTCGPNEWAVVKDDSGETEGCYPTEQAAKDQQAALYAKESAASKSAAAQDVRAAVDNSEWDGNAAMSACETAADYRAICAGRRDGDPDQRQTWALPHHKRPGSPPNAAGVRNSLSRLPQTQGLVNKEEAQRHLDRHMSTIQAQAAAVSPDEARQLRHGTIPAGAARSLPFAAQFEVRMVERDGKQLYHLHGVATAYEQPYEMWDLFGSYKESVDQRSGADSLAKGPDVAFLVNHKGVTMARTTNGSLELRETLTGLEYDAYLNPQRQDVRDLVAAVQDRNLTESSFAFMITAGEWNDDYTEFRIKAYDIDRGDVSAVNYGANPHTSVAARSREILADLDYLPVAAARAAHARLEQRLPDLGQRGSQTPPAPEPPARPTAQPTGASVNLVRARLALMDTTRP